MATIKRNKFKTTEKTLLKYADKVLGSDNTQIKTCVYPSEKTTTTVKYFSSDEESDLSGKRKVRRGKENVRVLKTRKKKKNISNEIKEEEKMEKEEEVLCETQNSTRKTIERLSSDPKVFRDWNKTNKEVILSYNEYDVLLKKYENLLNLRNTEAELLAKKLGNECSQLEQIDKKVIETLQRTNSELCLTISEQSKELEQLRNKNFEEESSKEIRINEMKEKEMERKELIGKYEQLKKQILELEELRKVESKEIVRTVELLNQEKEKRSLNEKKLKKLKKNLKKNKKDFEKQNNIKTKKEKMQNEELIMKVEEYERLLENERSINRKQTDDIETWKKNIEIENALKEKTNQMKDEELDNLRMKLSKMKEKKDKIVLEYQKLQKNEKPLQSLVGAYEKLCGIKVSMEDKNELHCLLKDGEIEFKLIVHSDEIEYVPGKNTTKFPEHLQEDLFFSEEMLPNFFLQLKNAE